MLQVSRSQPPTEEGDVEAEDTTEPQPSTSSGITRSSRPPPTKKTKPSAAGVADTLRDYLHAQDTEAQEVKAEVDIHAFCTEIA